jgi:hypothetical protein
MKFVKKEIYKDYTKLLVLIKIKGIIIIKH